MKHIYYFIALCLSFTLVSCGNERSISVYPVQVGNAWGYVDEMGKYIVNPTFDFAEYFSCGVARVELDGKVGYIKPDGKYAIEPEYAGGTSFAEGKAFVVRDSGELECVNTAGKKLFTLDQIEMASMFSEGIAVVANADGEFGFINKKGKVIIDLKYDLASDFSNGLAYVESGDSSGFIDPKGNLVISDKGIVPSIFNDGLAVIKIDDKYGYISDKGEIVIPCQFEDVTSFSEGFAAVRVGGKYGFINESGQIVINPQYDKAHPFSEGFAVVVQEDKYGLVDKTGKMVISPSFEFISDFSGGCAFFKQNEKYGLIDNTGRIVAVPQFDQINPQDDDWFIFSGKLLDYTFVSEFIKRYSNGKWENHNGTSTLDEISDDPHLKFHLIDNSSLVSIIKQGDEPELESMVFDFGEAIKQTVKVSGILGFSHAKTVYKSWLTLNALNYYFSLSEVCSGKVYPTALALAQSISNAYGAEYVEDSHSFLLSATDTTPKTEIIWSRGKYDNEVVVKIDFKNLTAAD